MCIVGFIEIRKATDAGIVPLFRASAFPGGLVDAADFTTLRDEKLGRPADSEQDGGPIDRVLLDLHGPWL